MHRMTQVRMLIKIIIKIQFFLLFTQCMAVKDCLTKAKDTMKSCYNFTSYLKQTHSINLTYCDNYEQGLITTCVAGEML